MLSIEAGLGPRPAAAAAAAWLQLHLRLALMLGGGWRLGRGLPETGSSRGARPNAHVGAVATELCPKALEQWGQA